MAAKTKGLRDKAESIFNKIYKLKTRNDAYSLPQVNTIFSTPAYTIEPLMMIKHQLNDTKNLLNSKDIEKWRRHTGKTNPCGLVVRHLREAVGPELCTQAWVKFYEIVSTCNIIPLKCIENRTLTTLHLCEAPGAFIASLNHYIKCNFNDIQWSWLASTLNPFYEGNDTKRMISGERFIIETLSHWNFGESNDGDLMQWSNLECLLQAVGGAGKVDIVTADGSISCADEPEKQELAIGQLLYCEVIAALVNLSHGGSLVIKMFTMFECGTIGILYLLSCFFEEVEIIKPGTSKPGNSEVYCVCTLFVGGEYLSKDLLNKLQSHYTCDAPDAVLFPLDTLPEKFLESIINCARTFSEFQTNAINKNIELFEKPTKGKWKFLTKLRGFLVEEFISRFNVHHLDQELCVVSHMHLDGSQLSYWPEGSHETYCNSGAHHTGSYESRVVISKLGWHARVVFPIHESDSLITQNGLVQDILNSVSSVVWLKCPQDVRSDSNNWTVKLGKPIEVVLSSRFCSATFISQLNEARENAKVLLTANGRQLIEELKRVADEKVQREESTSCNMFNIVNVLLKCGLLNNEISFVDISGNSRFALELLKKAVCCPKQCAALVCEKCRKVEREETIDEFERVLVHSCCSSCKSTEFQRLRSFCVERSDEENHSNSLEHSETFREMKHSTNDCSLPGCSTGHDMVVVDNPPSARNDDATCERTVPSSTKPCRIILGSVFKQCSIPERYDELSTRVVLLNQCIAALQLLTDNDCFVCEVSDSLTQFTVGIIYLLHLLFEHISLVSPQFCPTSKQFLVCRSFINSNDTLILLAHMESVLELLTSKPAGKDVVSFVSIAKLFSEKFYKYIRSHTTNHVTAQMKCIIKCERLLMTNNAS